MAIPGILNPSHAPRAIGQILLSPPKINPKANEKIAVMLIIIALGLVLVADNRIGANNTRGTANDVYKAISSR